MFSSKLLIALGIQTSNMRTVANQIIKKSYGKSLDNQKKLPLKLAAEYAAARWGGMNMGKVKPLNRRALAGDAPACWNPKARSRKLQKIELKKNKINHFYTLNF